MALVEMVIDSLRRATHLNEWVVLLKKGQQNATSLSI